MNVDDAWAGVAAGTMTTLREICLAYPEAVEEVTFDTPTFKVRKKIFALIGTEPGLASVWCKAGPGVQEAFVTSEPERYFRPPYFGPKGWVAAWVSTRHDPDWLAIEDLIDESYRLVAPKRLARELDPPDGG